MSVESMSGPLVSPVLDSTAGTLGPVLSEPATDVTTRDRLAAYYTLTKPRIVVMVLLTTAVGYWLGARGASHPLAALAVLVGTGLVAGGASVWNQVVERRRDAAMRRTARRPIPRGVVGARSSFWFGGVITLTGLLILFAIRPLAAVVALATFVMYVALYTPMKAWTTLNTAVGAVPGALPPVIGWAAATGRLGIESWALFLIVFLWQFPHFLAIAWIYRDDYMRGGYRMLPSIDPDGDLTGRHATAYALTLIPCGLMPAVVGLAGPIYFLGAMALGVYYATYAVRFWLDVSDQSARRLLRASFLYLPAILLLLVLNPFPA